MKRTDIKEAIKDGLPIAAGFIPIAMAFGMLSKAAHITLLESLGFSMLVFAGASQFIALNLLMVGVNIGEIILTTLLVNFRHFLFSASLAPKLNTDIKKTLPIIAFGITDEIFSIASLKKRNLTKEYMLSLEICAYFALALGTYLGYVMGGILPKVVQLGMGITLYALFAAILMPEVKKSIKILLLLLLSGFVNSALLYIIGLSQGWSIVATILIVSFMGLFIKEGKKHE